MVYRVHMSLYGLKQSPRARFGIFNIVVQQFDDISITGNDQQRLLQLKQYLANQFQTKYLGKLRYFLGIEVAQSKDVLVISRCKYAMHICEETNLLNAKPIRTPMDPSVKLLPNQRALSDSGRYKIFVRNLNYLTVTHPDISFAVSVVIQFLNSLCQEHMGVVIRILRYIKYAPGKGLVYEDKGHTKIFIYSDVDWVGSSIDRRSAFGYCVLVRGSLISWKSMKQNVVARLSVEAEHRSMEILFTSILSKQS
ncbi:uncharacterized mitochondrial protein AtMg00810-like [Lathyrus oleraceus]|uniref:uncharacterized mitochondrial protein AtMg00810-like n=1 Tax=Pisum sativum TaxID=3888 RepID=UPI0021D1BADC|nr:uncharacterized mitochondrial protein AtMg00810-like [Pisum sativum]